MLYFDTKNRKTVHVPGFRNSRRNIPTSYISLCEESCIISKCVFHKKNPGCGKEEELFNEYYKKQKQK
jgi:hypothetical protein